MLLLLVLAAPVLRAASLVIEADSLQASGWRASGVSLALRPEGDGVSLSLEVDGVGPERRPRLLSVSVRCSAGAAEPERLDCARIGLRLGTSEGEGVDIDASGSLRLADDGFELALAVLRLGEGDGSLRLARHGAVTSVDLVLEAVDVAVLAMLVRALGPALPEVGAGRVDLRVRLTHDGVRLRDLDARAEASGIGFSDAAGLNAGEGLGARLLVRLADDRLRAELATTGGEVLLEPMYVDFTQTPVVFAAAGHATAGGALEVDDMRLSQAGVFEATGSAQFSAALEPLRFRLDVARTALAPVVDAWLQPWLPAELTDGVEALGDFAAGVSWNGDHDVGARLDLYEAALGDKQARFAFHGLEGRLQWHSTEPRVVTLRLAGAELYRLHFGATHLIGEVRGRRFELAAPVRAPLFGGALRVDTLQVSAMGADDFELRLAGELEPLDLQLLSAALAWPAFGGTLSGTLPELRYSDGVLALGSELRTRVFEGEVVVRDLRIEEPLGVVPVLRADVSVHDVSLAALTEVFSFGDVSGRLEGEVNGLVLRDWQPRAFDARFATPAGDRSEHRISQRAVNNLASIGGAAGVLSAGFLGFFSEFNYDRLGISCVLRNDVCRMGGVEDADDGYYIVVGGGLPRIDVVGFNRDVDWSVLVERLVRATRAEGPVVR